jgi:RNA polymerase sigma-70 factor (ECF subfamily)
MLTVLETLAPTERAVFVLHEVFDVPYDEIAEAVDKSPAAVRQIAHRARDHVAARRPRMKVERDEQERVIEQFLAALNTGDLQGLMDVMAPDVVLVTDGGGVVTAAVRPIVGVEKLGTFFAAGLAAVGPGLVGSPMWLNGAPGARVEVNGSLVGAISLTVENGRITRIHSIVNPQKLARLDWEAALAR